MMAQEIDDIAEGVGLQTVVEINKYKGIQFSEHWVMVLNAVIRNRYLGG